MNIRENIARVQERMAAACRRVGRRPESVRLIAVTKTVSAERIREAYQAGLRDFGENRVQEAKEKRPALSDLPITWHMIGHLQTNKAKPACELFHWMHSIDSGRLAEKLQHEAQERRMELPVLVEVNLGEEATKSGVREAEVQPLLEQMSALDNLRVRGLMVIPPFFENPDEVRPYFRRLRKLAEDLAALRLRNVSLGELSMGMSHDFEVAIEEGATMVRVGTALFGRRATGG